MPKIIYNNVIDHRLLDGDVTVEDVMTITPPEIKFKTTEMDVAGMIGAIDIPDISGLEKMTMDINHNKGLNHEVLNTPGKHKFEFRIARQRLSTSNAELSAEGVKIRVTAMFVGEKRSEVERGNPMATTNTYSVLRFEEEVNGKQTTCIDVLAGIVKVNGKDYSNDYQHLLN